MTNSEEIKMIEMLDKLKWNLCDLLEKQDDTTLLIEAKIESINATEKKLKELNPGFVHEHPLDVKAGDLVESF